MYRLDDERLEGSPAERDLVVLVDLSNPLVRIVPKLHGVWILDDSVWNQELDSMIFVGPQVSVTISKMLIQCL